MIRNSCTHLQPNILSQFFFFQQPHANNLNIEATIHIVFQPNRLAVAFFYILIWTFQVSKVSFLVWGKRSERNSLSFPAENNKAQM